MKNAEGNILDDEVLINTLAESKVTGDKIQEKVKELPNVGDLSTNIKQAQKILAQMGGDGNKYDKTDLKKINSDISKWYETYTELKNNM